MPADSAGERPESAISQAVSAVVARLPIWLKRRLAHEDASSAPVGPVRIEWRPLDYESRRESRDGHDVGAEGKSALKARFAP